MAADSEEDAKAIHPDGGHESWPSEDSWGSWTWVDSTDKVSAELVGEAVEGMKRGVICASFHAG